MALTDIDEYRLKHFIMLDKAVSHKKIMQDKVYIEKNLRVGIELESANIMVDCNVIEDMLKSNTNYRDTNSFVQRVYHDLSIHPMGVEVVFKGSGEGFRVYLEKLEEVEKTLRKLCTTGNMRMANHSVSAHITLLTAQNKELPEIYLANIYQLFRKYSDAILWLASATCELIHNLPGEEVNKNRIVRRGLINYASPIFSKSPQFNTMQEIAENEGRLRALYFKCSGTPEFIGAEVNKAWMQFLPNGNPSGFCIEFRFPDRITVPVALVSLKCLLQAMIFKAVELSEFGILNVNVEAKDDMDNDWAKTKDVTQIIADGRLLTKNTKEYLKAKALGFINFLKPNLMSFDGESIEVLRKMAEMPISLRYARGDNDVRIGKELYPKETKEFETEKQIRNIIQLQLVAEDNCGKWAKSVGRKLGISERAVRHTLTKLAVMYSVRFDKELRTYILVG